MLAAAWAVACGGEPEPFTPVEPAAGLPSSPWGYEVPVLDDAPWPSFRRDARNTGRSPLPARDPGGAPWAFRTGKGIFSTAVIDGQGVVYVGSADHVFYAIGPDGRERWRWRTGDVIDSAAVLGRLDPDVPASGDGTVTFLSGDGSMTRLRTDPGIADPDDRLVWRFEAERRPGTSFNNWWEGNAAIGPDGSVFAGNTNFQYYAVSPDGLPLWTYPTGSNAWSMAAFRPDGAILWGSLDTRVHAVSPAGRPLWTRRTLGFVAASAALGRDGTAWIGSFDGHLYALDADTGAVRWRFETGDHVYASVALDEDDDGAPRAVYLASTDGFVYALDPDGRERWRFEAGDPVRSSPALGAGPDGEPGAILYFGAGDGRLYAVDAGNGALRWSFDTTPDDPELRERNDLNASPALGESGVVISGEHGFVWHVPYDYCLRARDDPRCDTGGGDGPPPDGIDWLPVSAGGNTGPAGPRRVPAAGVLTWRLRARRGGEAFDARLCNRPFGCPDDALLVTAEPAFPLRFEASADGRFLHVVPEGLLEPGARHRLRVRGRVYEDAWRLGNLVLWGREAGVFDEVLGVEVEASEGPWPLAPRPDAVPALEWTRFAAPIPTMLPSLNQIGFDYIEWIVGFADPGGAAAAGTEEAPLLAWAIGARRDAADRLVVDPESDFLLPLSGVRRGDAFELVNRRFEMAITGIPIPFDRLVLRGRLGADGRVRPGASLWAEAEALSIPNFGPMLVLGGLANRVWGKLLVSGTWVTRPVPVLGSAHRRPDGVSLARLGWRGSGAGRDRVARAELAVAEGSAYPAEAHRPGLLLVDAATGVPVALDYAARTRVETDATGDVRAVELSLPDDLVLPRALEAWVWLDVWPLHRGPIDGEIGADADPEP